MHRAAKLAVMLLLVSAAATAAQGRDRNDRSLGTESSRERAENRIERLKMDRIERDRQDKARAESGATKRSEGAKKPKDGTKNTARP